MIKKEARKEIIELLYQSTILLNQVSDLWDDAEINESETIINAYPFNISFDELVSELEELTAVICDETEKEKRKWT